VWSYSGTCSVEQDRQSDFLGIMRIGREAHRKVSEDRELC
jgi:hypothetical protein